MGMSASQARLLAITSRMNDIELRSQQIANTKIRLADESEQVAQNYTNALNATKLTYTDYSSGQAQIKDLKPSNLSEFGFRLVDKNGKELKDANNITATQMYEMIQSGEFRLEQPDKENQGKYKEVSTSSNTLLQITSDNTNLAKAEAEYNAQTAKINSKEKQLDQQLKEMDTEHSALSTEQDSIKSLIKDNVDKTFNLFS